MISMINCNINLDVSFSNFYPDVIYMACTSVRTMFNLRTFGLCAFSQLRYSSIKRCFATPALYRNRNGVNGNNYKPTIYSNPDCYTGTSATSFSSPYRQYSKDVNAVEVPTTAGINKIPLTAETVRYLEKSFGIMGTPTLENMTPAEARALLNRLALELEGDYKFDGTKQDWRIPSKEVQDGLPLRVYRPSQLPPDPVIFLYLHGGGHVVGGITAYEPCCTYLAEYCNVIVASLEYRLAPEHRWPAGLQDVECTARWLLDNKTAIGGSNKSIVGVGGDSAGGWLSAQVCHSIPGLQFQIHMYGHVMAKALLESAKEFPDGPELDAQTLEWYYSHYLPDVPDLLTNPLYNPYLQPRFDHLPPALFIVPECDPLRDDSYEYAKKLTAAGVRNEIVLMKGTCHGLFAYPRTNPEFASKAYGAIAEFLKTLK